MADSSPAYFIHHARHRVSAIANLPWHHAKYAVCDIVDASSQHREAMAVFHHVLHHVRASRRTIERKSA